MRNGLEICMGSSAFSLSRRAFYLFMQHVAWIFKSDKSGVGSELKFIADRSFFIFLKILKYRRNLLSQLTVRSLATSYL